jgi:hypothetical protein
MSDGVASPLSEFIDPTMVALYLNAHGWEEQKRTDTFSTWALDADPPTSLFLPLAHDFGDYEDRLIDLVAQLARIEDRDEAVVATNLRYASADLVRIRLASPRVGPGELPIDDGARLFEGAREMMYAAACAAVQPRANYGPKRPRQATEYMNRVRLGQTERGSYVVTVISDFDPEEPLEQLSLIPGEIHVPFERRVTTRLVEALRVTHDAAHRVLSGDEPQSAFEEGVERGVSAQLCEAIADMGTEDAPTNVHVQVDWAASKAPTVESAPVIFEPATLPVLASAVAWLKQLGPFEDVLVEGTVSRLIRGKDDEVGTIVIEGTADGEKRNVHVELPDDQYDLAIQAHHDRKLVRITGTLEKAGRPWVLTNTGRLTFHQP